MVHYRAAWEGLIHVSIWGRCRAASDIAERDGEHDDDDHRDIDEISVASRSLGLIPFLLLLQPHSAHRKADQQRTGAWALLHEEQSAKPLRVHH